MNPTATIAGFALEDIPAGATVEIDAATGKLRRSRVKLDVHLVSIRLALVNLVVGGARPRAEVVCSCDPGRPLLTLEYSAAFDTAADIVSAHLAETSELDAPEPARGPATGVVSRGRYAADVAEHLTAGRHILVWMPVGADLRDELTQLEHALRAVLPASLYAQLTFSRASGKEGIRFTNTGGWLKLQTMTTAHLPAGVAHHAVYLVGFRSFEELAGVRLTELRRDAFHRGGDVIEVAFE